MATPVVHASSGKESSIVSAGDSQRFPAIVFLPPCAQMLVIDEADEMLNKGFKEQIYDIYRCI